jgi:hypothetical protein
MKLSKLYENLCSYDTRNPRYDAEYDSDFEARSISCYCDNCFYGRDELAMIIVNMLSYANDEQKGINQFISSTNNLDRDMSTMLDSREEAFEDMQNKILELINTLL